ncbi:MAG: PQQ-binding-like beta-propeller repeat protein [Candidatus Omnitrophica bacterium]|nr:PQQ-binding-like beta-propeller repeat protein [Candidatus Omnitrophota bacterium]
MSAAVRAGQNWPQFRGPDGQGHSDALDLPVTWSEQTNIVWKTPVHGRAWSSPVVWANQVWVSTATEDGKQLFAVCLDLATGRIIRDIKLFDVAKPQSIHAFNSYASPTPVIEQGRIYVTFGSPGTACVDTQTGAVLWDRRDFVCNHFRGAGSSPIIYGNLLIMHFDGSDHQFVVALDKQTGKTVWRTERSIDFQDLNSEGKPKDDGDWRKAFSTPLVAVFNQQPILLSLGSKALYAYQPDTGNELWRLEYRECYSGSTRPVVDSNFIYYCTGFSRGELWAVRPEGQGVLDDSHVVWKVKRDVPVKPSILLIGQSIFMIDDNGAATWLDAKTGKRAWRERLEGHYSASPVCAEGRIYCSSEEGLTTVLEAQPTFNGLATNRLDDGFMASPAIAGKALILRTKTSLYRVEKPD